MQRIRNLNQYQKAILLFVAGIVLVFSVLYPIPIARVGFEYRGAILVPSKGNGGAVYSGKIQG